MDVELLDLARRLQTTVPGTSARVCKWRPISVINHTETDDGQTLRLALTTLDTDRDELRFANGIVSYLIFCHNPFEM